MVEDAYRDHESTADQESESDAIYLLGLTENILGGAVEVSMKQDG